MGIVTWLWATSGEDPSTDASESSDRLREEGRRALGSGSDPRLSRAIAKPSTQPPAFTLPEPGLMGAARAIDQAGLGHDRRCTLLADGLEDLDALSAYVPARQIQSDQVRVIRREPQGHRVVDTASGPVEIAWTEHECTIDTPRSGKVTGEVLALDGRPVASAQVSVCAAETTTDRDGRFELEATVDGSAPLMPDSASCVLRAHHPDHGSSTATVVDLLDGADVRIALEHEVDPVARQMQAQVLEEERQAIVSGEVDPAFEAAAEDADRLAELAQQPGLDAPTRYTLEQAAKDLIENAGDNREILEALSRGPGR